MSVQFCTSTSKGIDIEYMTSTKKLNSKKDDSEQR